MSSIGRAKKYSSCARLVSGNVLSDKVCHVGERKKIPWRASRTADKHLSDRQS